MICFNCSKAPEKQQTEAFKSSRRDHWGFSQQDTEERLSREAAPFRSLKPGMTVTLCGFVLCRLGKAGNAFCRISLPA